MGAVIQFPQPSRLRLVCNEISQDQADENKGILENSLNGRPNCLRCDDHGAVFFCRRYDGAVDFLPCPCGAKKGKRGAPDLGGAA